MPHATQPGQTVSPAAFYDPLADNYDTMTGFEGRARVAAGFVRRLLAQYSCRSALDVACGTGVFAMALAQAGVRTTGADLSRAMLRQARRRASAMHLPIRWAQAPMQQPGEKLTGRFDLILCMGNSLPHLLTAAELDAAFLSFRRLLAPGGHLVLHLLNYSRVLKRQERVVEINRQGNAEFVRFYDFPGGNIRFNLLHITWDASGPVHRLSSVELHPYVKTELRAVLAAHGFKRIQTWGGLDFRPFAGARSDVLLLIARRDGFTAPSLLA